MNSHPLDIGRRPLGAALLAGVLVAIACSSRATSGPSLAAGSPFAPADGAKVSYYAQPITLRATNGVTTGTSQLTLTFEVSTDSDFRQLVFSKSVPQATSGQTAVVIDTLAAGHDYFWRLRDELAGAGVTSQVFKFSVGSQVVLQPPVPLAPASNSLQSRRPVLVVRDAVRTGPGGQVSYQFEVSNDPQFVTRVATGTASELPGQTSYPLTADLEPGAALFWRAKAIDLDNGVQSEWSSRSSLTIRTIDDGKYRYRLELFVPDGCDKNWSTSPTLPSVLNPFVFDDALIIHDDTLTFSPNLFDGETWENLPKFRLDLTRAVSGLVGTIGGETYHPGGGSPALIVQVGPVPLVRTEVRGVTRTDGVARSDGSFEGMFDGAVNVFDTYNRAWLCSSRAMRWKLSPWSS